MKKYSGISSASVLLMVFISTILVVVVQLVLRVPINTIVVPGIANSFLETIAQVDAGILAIIFSVSVLAVEITSDKYSTRLLGNFAFSRATILTFVSLTLPILISVIAIGIQSIPMYQLGFLIMVFLFLFSFAILPYYFLSTLWLLDPRNLAALLRDEGIDAHKNHDQ